MSSWHLCWEELADGCLREHSRKHHMRAASSEEVCCVWVRCAGAYVAQWHGAGLVLTGDGVPVCGACCSEM